MEVCNTEMISILYNVKNMELLTAVSRASAIDYSATEFLPVCLFSCKNYKSVETVAQQMQIIKVPYYLREPRKVNKKMLGLSIHSNRFDYTKVVLDATLCSKLGVDE